MRNESLGLWGFFQYELSMSSILISRNKKKIKWFQLSSASRKDNNKLQSIEKKQSVTLNFVFTEIHYMSLNTCVVILFPRHSLRCWLKELAYVNNPCRPSRITVLHNSQGYWWMLLKSSISLMHCDIIAQTSRVFNDSRWVWARMIRKNWATFIRKDLILHDVHCTEWKWIIPKSVFSWWVLTSTKSPIATPRTL